VEQSGGQGELKIITDMLIVDHAQREPLRISKEERIAHGGTGGHIKIGKVISEFICNQITSFTRWQIAMVTYLNIV